MINIKQNIFLIFLFIYCLNTDIFCAQLQALPEEKIELSIRPVGLNQIGNNCYMNCVLQSLYRCDIVTNFLLKPTAKDFYIDNSLSKAYVDFVKEYSMARMSSQADDLTINPEKIYIKLIRALKLQSRSQEDAQEAFSEIFRQLANLDFTDHTIDNVNLSVCSDYAGYISSYQKYLQISKEYDLKLNLREHLFKLIGQFNKDKNLAKLKLDEKFKNLAENKLKEVRKSISSLGQTKESFYKTCDSGFNKLVFCAFNKAGLGKSIRDYFDFELASVVTCLNNSDHKSVKTESAFLVQLINSDQQDMLIKKSVKDNLRLFFTKEKVEKEDDFWHCPECKKKVAFTKELFMNSLTEYFVIQFKLFKYNAGSLLVESEESVSEEEDDSDSDSPVGNNIKSKSKGSVKKQEFNVGIELYNLDLREFLSPDKLKENPEYEYDLIASCWHSGSASGGHYVAIVKSDEEFYLCNDSKVEKLEQTKLKKIFEDGKFSGFTPYLLFYKRKENFDLINLTVSLTVLK